MDDERSRDRVLVADTEHLRILSILHYVFGGLQLFGAVSGLIFVGMGSLFAAGGIFAPATSPQDRAAMQFMGMLFSAIGLGFVVYSLAIGCGLIYAGLCLGRAERYVYCLIAAALECTAFPLGTALGVFTIIVLQRQSVKERFERAP